MQETLTTDGDSPMVEMFRMFPRESALVMQRGIELGVACNVLLVVHCCMLMRAHWALASATALDWGLGLSCVIRLALVAPRPHYWIKTWHLFAEARQQPTPQLVAQRLVDIYAHPFAKERCLLLSYYVWLCAISVMLCLAPIELSPLALGLRWHCLMSFISIVMHRVLCVSMFYFLVRRDQTRHGAGPEALEKCSQTASWGEALLKLGFAGDDPVSYGDPKACCICLGCYASGEQLRVLKCGHYFHRRCVDTWILKHRSCCPLCLLVVGPPATAG